MSTVAVRTSRRRGTITRWIGASLLAIGGALLLISLNGTAPNTREPLHPEHASPEGAKALVQVLNEHGVPVKIAQGREEALRLLGAGVESTLVMTAPTIPSDAAFASIHSLVAEAEHTVFLAADEGVLSNFGLGTISSESAAELVNEPGNSVCPAREFSEIGEIRAQVFFEPESGVQGCFISADGTAALLVTQKDPGATAGATVSLLDATELFDNAHLAENGNAALAFALLGTTDQVVWYVPSPEDLAADRIGTIAALTPTWVTPAMLLLVFTAITAGIWRGRRFGPLVEERLPVTVRASETMIGRARLAARHGDSAHAAAALREGAVRRITQRLGLPRTATPEQIGRAVPGEPALLPLMIGPLPASDAELAQFARALGAILDRIDPEPRPPQAKDSSDNPNAPDERSTL